MRITIEVDTEKTEDIDRAMKTILSLKPSVIENEDDGTRMLNILFVEKLSTRAIIVLKRFMSFNEGVVRTIYDLERVLNSGKFRVSGYGPKTKIELKLAVEKLLSEHK